MRSRGFTLLEVLVTLAVVGCGIVPVLQLREAAVNNLIEARNADWARSIARELLSELEFHELDRNGGPLENYPGFEYQIEIEDVDLVTGEGDEEATEREREKQQKREDSANVDQGSRFQPGDLLTDDEKQELVYPVRKVKLTLTYPNLSNEKEPRKLVIETIVAALPEYVEARAKELESPFGSNAEGSGK